MMISRPQQDEKKRKWLPVAVLLLMACFIVYYAAYHHPKTEIIKPVDGPKPKMTRPERRNTARSEPAKKMAAKTHGGEPAPADKPYGCIKKSTYDVARGILRKELDYDCDGIATECVDEELNEYGEPVRRVTYDKCGRKPSKCMESEYNEYGEEIGYEYDRDCDGRVDKCTTIKRNDHGDIIEITNDKGCDGVLEKGEWSLCSSYEYDEDGLIVSTREGNCGEEPDYCYRYEYDLATGVQRAKGDDKCDGTVDVCQVNYYREGYKTPDSFTENGCDGVWKSCNILGEVDNVVRTFEGREICEKKFEEIVKGKKPKR